jgi:hypothetical protein
MPIGAITKPLGISNVTVPNASSFASTVLQFPANIPIYQGQLIHSTEWREGPAKAAAEWCGSPDNEYNQNCTIRQISAFDTVFGRRNLNSGSYTSFVAHRNNYNNQLYYVTNEPETNSALGTPDSCGNECWSPRDRTIDSYVSGVFTDPNTQFWQFFPEGFSQTCNVNSDYRRIQPEALAYIFLRLKREAEALGRGHIVLPPSAASTALGWLESYWQEFYDGVHYGAYGGIDYQAGLPSIADLKAIHLHHYSKKPLELYASNPIESVAYSATLIRRAIKWYRYRYNSGGSLPVDVLLTEMGLHWTIDEGYLRWAGGWDSLKKGLTWWNSYLCWLTRRAATECNLQSPHLLHACMHEASVSPYATTLSPEITDPPRNQFYFNADAWDTYVYYYVPVIVCKSERPDHTWVFLNEEGRYLNNFLAYSPISWGGLSWHTTPFGACASVWARVGSDPITGNLNTGWVANTQSGVIGDASVTLPAGYSTVYFPIIKDIGTFPTNTQFFMRWIRSDNAICDRGYMDMGDFQDSAIYYGWNEIPTQYTYAAMIFPVTCLSSSARTVTVRINRNLSGPQVWLGRPIALPGVCSWFWNQ